MSVAENIMKKGRDTRINKTPTKIFKHAVHMILSVLKR